MKLSYYPGCTLKTKACNLEESAMKCFEIMGVECVELPRWNCCGAVYSLADDDLIHQVAPVRDLVRVKEQGHEMVLTLCSMCYNTLSRANNLMRQDEKKRDTINRFMDEEIDYAGEVKVVHILDFLRDDFGWDPLRALVTNPLTGLRVTPYYGCTLLRPADVAIETPGQPEVFETLMQILGAEVVRSPYSTECCGSYHAISHPDAALDVSQGILSDAVGRGANALALVCPLCDYNLGHRQDAMIETIDGAAELPVFYVTQLLAIALGVDVDSCRFDLNRDAAIGLLREKELV